MSDAYLEKSDNPMLELTVKVININPSAHHPILQECRSIYEYSWFVQRIRDYTRQGDSRDSAIQKAMADCIQHGIMVDFIQVHGSEVRNMLFTEFNLEDALEVRGQECYDEGKLEGQERVNSLIKLLLQNKRFSDVEKAVEDSAFQQLLFQEFHL